MTPVEALEILAEEHEPYVPTTIEVFDDGEFRPPTMDERAETVMLWCDGCNRPASRCAVLPIVHLGLGRP